MSRMEGLKRFAQEAAGPAALALAVLAAAALSALVPSPDEREGVAGSTQPTGPAPSYTVGSTEVHPSGYSSPRPVIDSTAERR